MFLFHIILGPVNEVGSRPHFTCKYYKYGGSSQLEFHSFQFKKDMRDYKVQWILYSYAKIENINFLKTSVQATGQTKARDYDFSEGSLRKVRKSDISSHIWESRALN